MCLVILKKETMCIRWHYLLIQLVKYEFYDNIIFKSQDLGHSLSNPGFDDLQVYFGHVHLNTPRNKHRGPLTTNWVKHVLLTYFVHTQNNSWE